MRMSKITHPRFVLPANTGRDIDPRQLLRQINVGNLMAVSGGVWFHAGVSSVIFPAGSGFQVLVTLEADDTYTVRRLFQRKGEWFLHGERTNVYCDEVSEVVYYASCFRSYGPGEWEHKA
jgi:hypothetical protein